MLEAPSPTNVSLPALPVTFSTSSAMSSSSPASPSPPKVVRSTVTGTTAVLRSDAVRARSAEQVVGAAAAVEQRRHRRRRRGSRGHHCRQDVVVDAAVQVLHVGADVVALGLVAWVGVVGVRLAVVGDPVRTCGHGPEASCVVGGIATGPTRERVGAGVAVQQVLSVAAVQRVGAVASLEVVVTGAAGDRIVSGRAFQGEVIAVTTLDVVVAVAAVDEIAAAITEETVVEAIAAQHVVARPADHLLDGALDVVATRGEGVDIRLVAVVSLVVADGALDGSSSGRVRDGVEFRVHR